MYWHEGQQRQGWTGRLGLTYKHAYACVLRCSVVSDFRQPYGYSLPGSAVYGILQARILEWVAICSSRGSSQPKDWTCISCVSCIGRRILYHWATWEAHTPPCVNIASGKAVVWRRALSSGLCDDLDGWDKGVLLLGRRSKRDRIYAYMYT